MRRSSPARPPLHSFDSYAVKTFHPFDPVAKRAEAEIEHDGKRFKVAKGAPQVIVDLCEPTAEERAAISKTVDEDAAKGYRTLGVARTDDAGKWRFLGLLPLFDPPRDDCRVDHRGHARHGRRHQDGHRRSRGDRQGNRRTA